MTSDRLAFDPIKPCVDLDELSTPICLLSNDVYFGGKFH